MSLAVLDTNVLVSGFIGSSGPSTRSLDLWSEGAFDLVVCSRLLQELERTLRAPRMRRKVDTDDAVSFINFIQAEASIYPDPQVIERISRDPTDDFLIALALDAEAMLVTGDKDLLSVKEPPVLILTSRALVDALT